MLPSTPNFSAKFPEFFKLAWQQMFERAENFPREKATASAAAAW
jgi:hypothetical protein